MRDRWIRSASIRSRTSTLDKEQLQGLRDELAQALDTVERMQLRRAAEEAVQSEHPHFCCPVELKLMQDPVATDDGPSSVKPSRSGSTPSRRRTHLSRRRPGLRWSRRDWWRTTTSGSRSLRLSSSRCSSSAGQKRWPHLQKDLAKAREIEAALRKELEELRPALERAKNEDELARGCEARKPPAHQACAE